jgi:hypothetical protein
MCTEACESGGNMRPAGTAAELHGKKMQFIRKYKFRLGGDVSMGCRQISRRVSSEIERLGRVSACRPVGIRLLRGLAGPALGAVLWSVVRALSMTEHSSLLRNRSFFMAVKAPFQTGNKSLLSYLSNIVPYQRLVGLNSPYSRYFKPLQC